MQYIYIYIMHTACMSIPSISSIYTEQCRDDLNFLQEFNDNKRIWPDLNQQSYEHSERKGVIWRAFILRQRKRFLEVGSYEGEKKNMAWWWSSMSAGPTQWNKRWKPIIALWEFVIISTCPFRPLPTPALAVGFAGSHPPRLI